MMVEQRFTLLSLKTVLLSSWYYFCDVCWIILGFNPKSSMLCEHEVYYLFYFAATLLSKQRVLDLSPAPRRRFLQYGRKRGSLYAVNVPKVPGVCRSPFLPPLDVEYQFLQGLTKIQFQKFPHFNRILDSPAAAVTVIDEQLPKARVAQNLHPA